MLGDYVVTTLAGSGSAGYADGIGTAAIFYMPSYTAADTLSNLYVTEVGYHLVRKISSAGLVTTYAGSGAYSSEDGVGTTATFRYPIGITIDTSGFLFIADRNGNCVRKISTSALVTTYAGSGSASYSDGIGTSDGAEVA